MKKKYFYAAGILLLFLAAGIQPTFATIWVLPPAEGVTYSFGTWDSGSSTFTLTSNPDVGDSIQIGQNGLTLDGAGHKVNGSGQAGILVNGRTGITVKNVNVSGFAEGISLRFSNDNIVTDNTVFENNYGIWLHDSSNNEITGNTVSSNIEAGIWLQRFGPGSNYNTLTGNNIKDNTGFGMYIQDSSENTIYKNNFINNSVQARVIGASIDNDFGFKGSGNYWSDYPGEDTDGDGIGDTLLPHLGLDNYPFILGNGWSNDPPIANAGPDQIVEQDSPDGASVTLNGSGSTDDPIQPLTYTWAWDSSSAWGVNPTVILPPGTTTVTLTVDDGQFSDTDTVNIKVEDTMPPDITCPGDITIEVQGPDGVPVYDPQIQTFLNGASAYDDCDPEPTITNDNALDVFPSGDTVVTFTATDASGNSSTCEATVTVTVTVPVPVAAIEAIISVLEDMDVPEDAEKEVEKAVRELNKAIDEFNNDRIDKALNKIAKAVKELMKAQKDGADTQDVIYDLVDLAQEIAYEAIEDAIETVGADNLHVVKAQEHYDKALGNLADEKYDRAIKDFKKAYREAMKALGE